MKSAIWVQHKVSQRDREAIRRACELVDDPTESDLHRASADKEKRIAAAKQACRQRRARRNATANISKGATAL